MQAHANDLRVEVEKDLSGIAMCSATKGPTPAELDALVHRAVCDWRECELNPSVRALVEYAEKMTRSPATCVAEDVAILRHEGWTDEAIHDAVQVVAYFNYINRIADALGVENEVGLPAWGQTFTDSPEQS